MRQRSAMDRRYALYLVGAMFPGVGFVSKARPEMGEWLGRLRGRGFSEAAIASFCTTLVQTAKRQATQSLPGYVVKLVRQLKDIERAAGDGCTECRDSIVPGLRWVRATGAAGEILRDGLGGAYVVCGCVPMEERDA